MAHASSRNTRRTPITPELSFLEKHSTEVLGHGPALRMDFARWHITSFAWYQEELIYTSGEYPPWLSGVIAHSCKGHGYVPLLGTAIGGGVRPQKSGP